MRRAILGSVAKSGSSGNVVIAIVDDDVSVREAVSSLVRSLGHAVVAFERAEDFLIFDRRRRLRCVIADVRMPGMTGHELHARLVASDEPVPVILITAYPDEAARQRALRAGVLCYLAKPFSEDELLTCLGQVLGHHGGNGERP